MYDYMNAFVSDAMDNLKIPTKSLSIDISNVRQMDHFDILASEKLFFIVKLKKRYTCILKNVSQLSMSA